MGQIKKDVVDTIIRINPEHRAFLQTFLYHFDVNFGKTIRSFNTSITCYLISPDARMKDTFGFTDEILLVYSPYDRLEPRTIQVIEEAYGQQPFRARANPLTFFLITHDKNGSNWLSHYIVDHPQFRTPIVLDVLEVEKNASDGNFIKNKLSNQLFSRDIFDYQLPLDRDMYFFGRDDIYNSMFDSVRKGQNRGLFGLRKTGKTSLLFKLKRGIESSDIGYCFYIDCKRPDIRALSWLQMVDYLCDLILENRNQSTAAFTKHTGVRRFIEILKSTPGDKNVCFIFDEIEYVSPKSNTNSHWISDFIDFWQTMWSVQSEYRRLCFIVAGVSPYVSEIDLIHKTQNPMFGIVKGHNMTGLMSADLRSMVSRIGRQMGLTFTDDALEYLFSRYGGHPLLTRMACSLVNQDILTASYTRPFQVTKSYLLDKQSDRESELHFYCRHIVSELEEFYPDEYFLLETLAQGDIVSFKELSNEPEWIRHLVGYGILNYRTDDHSSISIPVLQKYIANEAARRRGSREPRVTVALEQRAIWLERRKHGILQEFRQFLKAAADRHLQSPYNSLFLPEANRISEISIVKDWEDFIPFITSLNICMVETIDILKGNGYFFGELRKDFPSLFNSLHRIRVYRNNADHLKLKKSVESLFDQYIRVDLMDKPLKSYAEPAFLLQQVVLDELFVALQIEINRLS